MTRSAPLPDSQLPASLPLNIQQQQQQAARHSAAPGPLQHQSSDPLVLASMHQVSAAGGCRAVAHWRWCAVLAPLRAHLLLEDAWEQSTRWAQCGGVLSLVCQSRG